MSAPLHFTKRQRMTELGNKYASRNNVNKNVMLNTVLVPF
jgi:hypothetical protein